MIYLIQNIDNLIPGINQFVLFVSDAQFVSVIVVEFFGRAEKKLHQIENWTSRKGIEVASFFIAKIRVTFVIEHFIRSQIHAGVQYLKETDTNLEHNKL